MDAKQLIQALKDSTVTLEMVLKGHPKIHTAVRVCIRRNLRVLEELNDKP